MEREEYNALEIMRKRALDIGDSKNYFLLCEQLGLKKRDSENPRLYESGRQPQLDLGGNLERAVIGGANPISNVRKRRVKTKTYMAFLARTEDISLNNIVAMRETLCDFFGYKFGPNGKTPLEDMNDSQVRGAFYGSRNYAEQRIQENQ